MTIQDMETSANLIPIKQLESELASLEKTLTIYNDKFEFVDARKVIKRIVQYEMMIGFASKED